MKFDKKITHQEIENNSIQFNIAELFAELEKYGITLQNFRFFNNPSLARSDLEEFLKSFKRDIKYANKIRRWLLERYEGLDEEKITRFSYLCFYCLVILTVLVCVLSFFILLMFGPSGEELFNVLHGEFVPKESEISFSVMDTVVTIDVILGFFLLVAFYLYKIMQYREDLSKIFALYYGATKELLRDSKSAIVYAVRAVLRELVRLEEQLKNKQFITEAELKNKPDAKQLTWIQEKKLRGEKLTPEDKEKGRLGLYYLVIQLHNLLNLSKRFPNSTRLYRQLLRSTDCFKKQFEIVDSVTTIARDLLVLNIVFFSWMEKERKRMLDGNKNTDAVIEVFRSSEEKRNNKKLSFSCCKRFWHKKTKIEINKNENVGMIIPSEKAPLIGEEEEGIYHRTFGK